MPAYKVLAEEANMPKREISDARWHQLTDNKAFSYKDDKEQPLQQKKPANNFVVKMISAIISFFVSGFGQLLLWLLLLALVGFVLYRIFSKSSSFFIRRNKILAEDSNLEDDIELIDWEKQLQKALSENDLRQAIRYSYMRVLQLLQNHALIQYRSDKTNYDYFTELNDSKYKQPFKQLSRTYEYTWYGHYPVTSPAYETYMQLFNQVKNQLSR